MVSCFNADLLNVIENYMRVTGMPHAAFGRASAGNPWLVTDLRAGGELPDSTANLVLDYVIGDMGVRLHPCEAIGQHHADRPVLEAVQ